MTFSRVKPLGWGNLDTLTAAEVNQLDLNLSRAIDGTFGGEYNPSAPIVVGGQGLDVGAPARLESATPRQWVENAIAAALADALGSGSYTPVASDPQGYSAATGNTGRWLRIGNQVIVFFQVAVTAATGTAKRFRISLPVEPDNFSGGGSTCLGHAGIDIDGSPINALVFGINGEKTALVEGFSPITAGNGIVHGSLIYRVAA